MSLTPPSCRWDSTFSSCASECVKLTIPCDHMTMMDVWHAPCSVLGKCEYRWRLSLLSFGFFWIQPDLCPVDLCHKQLLSW
jgi:hypothetical protein